MGSDSHLDVFLILDGIPGESRDASYSGGIEILGFTLGSESLAPKSMKKRKKERRNRPKRPKRARAMTTTRAPPAATTRLTAFI